MNMTPGWFLILLLVSKVQWNEVYMKLLLWNILFFLVRITKTKKLFCMHLCFDRTGEWTTDKIVERLIKSDKDSTNLYTNKKDPLQKATAI